MKCIKCGKEIQAEFNNCPYCGQNLQMVPDYSIYDEEDINVIMEETKDISARMNSKPTADKEAGEKERARRTAEQKKKKQLQLTIIAVVTICVALIVIALVAKTTIDNKNNNSYDYQIKQAQSAKIKGDVEQAEEYYLKALLLASEDEDIIEIRLDLAELYLNQKDAENAMKYYKDVLKYDSQNYTAYKALYKLYTEAGDTAAILELKNSATDQKVQNLFSDYAVDAPVVSLEGGTYSETLSITISAKKDYEIYYTLNGENPTKSGIKYTGAIKLEEAGMHTLKVTAKNTLGVYSAIVSNTYVIEYKAPSDPVVTPDGGEFDTETYVTIIVPAGCSAYYIWGEKGNETPTVESTMYVAPIKIPEGRYFLSVIIIDDKTGLESGVYRNIFVYTPAIEQGTEIETETGTEDSAIVE